MPTLGDWAVGLAMAAGYILLLVLAATDQLL